MLEVEGRCRRIGRSLAVGWMYLSCCTGCAAAPPTSAEIVVGAQHAVPPENLTVSVSGDVPENGKTIGVTAEFSGTGIDRLTIAYPRGRSTVVPRVYYEKLNKPWPRSLSLAYIMSRDSKEVAGIWIYLEFGDPQSRTDLKCSQEVDVDPVYQSFSLFYDPAQGTFEKEIKDACREVVPG